jgi:hypothetical protein
MTGGVDVWASTGWASGTATYGTSRTTPRRTSPPKPQPQPATNQRGGADMKRESSWD